jgi:hypothetical protein
LVDAVDVVLDVVEAVHHHVENSVKVIHSEKR